MKLLSDEDVGKLFNFLHSRWCVFLDQSGSPPHLMKLSAPQPEWSQPIDYREGCHENRLSLSLRAFSMLSSALSSEFGKTGWVGVETEAEIGEERTKQKFKVSSSTQFIVLCDIKKRYRLWVGRRRDSGLLIFSRYERKSRMQALF